MQNHPSRRRLKSRPIPIAFRQGPAIHPYDQLLLWLNHNSVNENKASRRLLKLPVYIQFADAYHLGVGSAHIGTTLDDLSNGAPLLSLDDSALGQSLLSILQYRCPPDTHHWVLWLEGYWGRLLQISPFDHMTETETHPVYREAFPFAILTIGEQIDVEQTHPEPLTAFIA